MNIIFARQALKDLKYWKRTDSNKVKKIKELLEDIQKSPYSGLGLPEGLKYDWSGWWSRRINQEHRLVYRVKNNTIEVASCRYHYKKWS
tara:strand:- start:682 stop:948 length:267 start_codon:yes stop_codon:yes gene_type:complete